MYDTCPNPPCAANGSLRGKIGPLLLILLLLAGCAEKEKVQPDVQPENRQHFVKIIDGRLAFADIQSFESLAAKTYQSLQPELSKLEINPNFNSLLSAQRNNRPNGKANVPGLGNETLASLLNADGIIQIGPWII